MDDTPALAGLVLAGGRSRRFGRGKALAQFGGGTLLQRAIERFSPCGACAVAARGNPNVVEHARSLGAAVLSDAPTAAEGPLAGIAAGLAWASAKGFALLAVAPCDTPLLAWRHYARLLAALDEAPAAFAATGDDDHPLCAVWRCQQHAALDTALAGGRHPSVRGILSSSGARRVSFSDTRAFANANTARELAELSEAMP